MPLLQAAAVALGVDERVAENIGGPDHCPRFAKEAKGGRSAGVSIDTQVDRAAVHLDGIVLESRKRVAAEIGVFHRIDQRVNPVADRVPEASGDSVVGNYQRVRPRTLNEHAVNIVDSGGGPGERVAQNVDVVDI